MINLKQSKLSLLGIFSSDNWKILTKRSLFGLFWSCVCSNIWFFYVLFYSLTILKINPYFKSRKLSRQLAQLSHLLFTYDILFQPLSQKFRYLAIHWPSCRQNLHLVFSLNSDLEWSHQLHWFSINLDWDHMIRLLRTYLNHFCLGQLKSLIQPNLNLAHVNCVW